MDTITALTPDLLRLALALSVLLVGLVYLRRTNKVSKLQKEKKEALETILFLLATEERHCEEHMVFQEKSLKNTIRKRVSTETNLTWNAKHSKASCLKELEKIEADSKKDNTFVTEFFKGLLLKFVK